MPLGCQNVFKNQSKNHKKIYDFWLAFELGFGQTLTPKFNQKIDRFFDVFLNGTLMIFGMIFGNQNASKIDDFFS